MEEWFYQSWSEWAGVLHSGVASAPMPPVFFCPQTHSRWRARGLYAHCPFAISPRWTAPGCPPCSPGGPRVRRRPTSGPEALRAEKVPRPWWSAIQSSRERPWTGQTGLGCRRSWAPTGAWWELCHRTWGREDAEERLWIWGDCWRRESSHSPSVCCRAATAWF